MDRQLAERFPEARLAALDAKWWMISQFDSVVVSMPAGTSADGAALTQVALGLPRWRTPKIAEERITPQKRFSPLAMVCR